MDPESFSKFFHTGKTVPSSTENCPEYDDLVILARGRGQEKWKEHISSCEACNQNIAVLCDDSFNHVSLMNTLMDEARASVESRRSTSVWAYFGALMTINRPRWVTIAVPVLAVLVGLTTLYQLKFSNPSPESALTYLERDDYSYALANLRNATENLPMPNSISSANREQQVSDLNKNIKLVNDSTIKVNALYAASKIQKEQRGEFSALLVDYRARLTPLRATLTSKSNAIPELTRTPDTESIASVLSAFDSAFYLPSKKNPPTEQLSTELQRAEAIRSAFQQIEVLSVDNANSDVNSRFITVMFRPSAQKTTTSNDTTQLESTINSMVNSQNISVKIVAKRDPTTAFTRPEN